MNQSESHHLVVRLAFPNPLCQTFSSASFSGLRYAMLDLNRITICSGNFNKNVVTTTVSDGDDGWILPGFTALFSTFGGWTVADGAFSAFNEDRICNRVSVVASSSFSSFKSETCFFFYVHGRHENLPSLQYGSPSPCIYVVTLFLAFSSSNPKASSRLPSRTWSFCEAQAPKSNAMLHSRLWVVLLWCQMCWLVTAGAPAIGEMTTKWEMMWLPAAFVNCHANLQ